MRESHNFPSKTPEDWKNYFSKNLDELRENYNDEIPEKMVDGSSVDNYKYKVRGNWFNAVRMSLHFASEHKYFPEEFEKEWRDFFKKWSDKRMSSEDQVRTTKEEIEAANKILLKAKEIIINSK